MKRFILLSCMAMTVMLASCSKKGYEANVGTFNDEVAGRYVFNMSVWNGDGSKIALWEDRTENNTTNCISAQLWDFECVRQITSSFGGYVDPIGESNTGRIYLKFPLQGVRYGDNGTYTVEDPVTAGITFIYEVTDDGQVSVLPTVDYSEVAMLKDAGYYAFVENARITQLSKGKITVDLNMGFYNFDTSSIVTGPVMMNYYNDKL